MILQRIVFLIFLLLIGCGKEESALLSEGNSINRAVAQMAYTVDYAKRGGYSGSSVNASSVRGVSQGNTSNGYLFPNPNSYYQSQYYQAQPRVELSQCYDAVTTYNEYLNDSQVALQNYPFMISDLFRCAAVQLSLSPGMQFAQANMIPSTQGQFAFLLDPRSAGTLNSFNSINSGGLIPSIPRGFNSFFNGMFGNRP